jgi:hypothetical protein
MSNRVTGHTSNVSMWAKWQSRRHLEGPGPDDGADTSGVDIPDLGHEEALASHVSAAT